MRRTSEKTRLVEFSQIYLQVNHIRLSKPSVPANDNGWKEWYAPLRQYPRCATHVKNKQKTNYTETLETAFRPSNYITFLPVQTHHAR